MCMMQQPGECYHDMALRMLLQESIEWCMHLRKCWQGSCRSTQQRVMLCWCFKTHQYVIPWACNIGVDQGIDCCSCC